MTYKELYERAKQIALQVFAVVDKPQLGCNVVLTYKETDRYNDGEVSFEGLTIFGLEDGTYQLTAEVYDPGVRYYPDGSGEPPSMDYEDIGEPYASFDDAVKEALVLLVRKRLEDFLSAEADAKMAAEQDAYEEEYQRRLESGYYKD